MAFFAFYYLCSASSQRNIFFLVLFIHHRMRESARVIVTQWLRWEKYGCDKVIFSNCKVFLFLFFFIFLACLALVFVAVTSWSTVAV